MTTATDTTALLRKALATSAVLWVETEPGRSWPLWFAADDVRVYLASGGQEQVLPDLPDRVVLAVRSKEDGGRLLRVPARTTRLQPGDAAWAGAVAALAARRLNAPAGDLGERWAREATVVSVLVPDGDPLEGPGHYQHESGARVPVDSPATTIGWRPWHAGGRPRLRRRRRR